MSERFSISKMKILAISALLLNTVQTSQFVSGPMNGRGVSGNHKQSHSIHKNSKYDQKSYIHQSLSLKHGHSLHKQSQKNLKSEENFLSTYSLINDNDDITNLQNILTKLGEAKLPFNQLNLAFARPNITRYTKNNLAYTGLGSYFEEGDGKGDAAFEQLKAVVKGFQDKNATVFLSVGGWDYSCNYDVYGDLCGDPKLYLFDSWYDVRETIPNPEEGPNKGQNIQNPDFENAKKSYDNIINLAVDLGVNGVDLDYEEFWHADKFANPWRANPNSEDIYNALLQNGVNYDNLVKYGAEPIQYLPYPLGGAGPYLLYQTVEKFHAIVRYMKPAIQKNNLKVSMAGPTVGGRPITSFVWGDNVPDINTEGGLWWGGNMKGFLYHVAAKDAGLQETDKILPLFTNIGIMTYDLCGDPTPICIPVNGVTDLSLENQVDIYIKELNLWLKNAVAPSLNKEGYKFIVNLEHFNIGPKLLFGVEVNNPAWPKNGKKLQLTNDNFEKILAAQQSQTNGLIIWQVFSEQNTKDEGTSVQYVLKRGCETFLANDTRFDCSSASFF